MQREIIESALAGHDTLALMPTGGGKSITYQLPALAGDGLCIVVTPLIALMKDQVDRLRAKGIPAVAIHSGMSLRQMDIALDNCVYGDVKFLYLAPERLASETFRLRLQRMNVALLAVDEAHCISQWGYDFRPSYLHIADIRKIIPDTPVLALTASATPMVAEDVMKHLLFAERRIVRSSFARPNLSYSVRHVEDKNLQLLRVVENVEGSGIVYVRLREVAESVAEYLREQGIAASYYHGGLPHAERNIRQDEWVSGKTRIMVATNAFGMGIDKADVRFVVHYSMCDSLESYYQEAGRAGRDGRRSYAVLLVAPDDCDRVRRKFDAEFPPIETVKSVYAKICSFLQVAIGDGDQSSFVFNIHEFCAREHIYRGTVQSALKLLQLNGYMTLTEELEHPARMIFRVSRDDLYKVRITRAGHDNILRAILRLYNGIFTEFRAIDEMEIASVSGSTYDEVHEFLRSLWRTNVIRYVPANHSPMIYFDEERLPTSDLYIAPETYSHRKELAVERFNNMISYAENGTECRSVVLGRYFGDGREEPCGVCDICLARKRKGALPAAKGLEERILERLAESFRADEPITVKQLALSLEYEPESIVDAVRRMLDNGTISSASDGRLTLPKER